MTDKDKPKLNREELLRIAAEVWDGSRPASDLEKYGLTLGDTLQGEEARALLFAELEALDAADASNEDPDGDPA